MAKTINATLPQTVHQRFAVDRLERETTNDELLTEIVAEHYEMDAEEALEALREERESE